MTARQAVFDILAVIKSKLPDPAKVGKIAAILDDVDGMFD